MAPHRDADALIPLTFRTFHILMALAEGSQNGYQIMLRAEENSGGKVRIGPGTLYEALHRMLDQGLIEEPEQGAGEQVNGRGQRFYRLSKFGRRVFAAETERLAADLRIARRMTVPGS